MTSYYRVMLGKKHAFVDECIEGGYIGADFDIHEDLTSNLPDIWRDFNKKYIPVFLTNVPDKSKVAAGLACGMLWTISKGMQEGDVILAPTGTGSYHVGQVTGPYYYVQDGNLFHRRPVKWTGHLLARADMSVALRRSSGSIGTVANVTPFAAEIEALIDGPKPPELIAADPTVEDIATFALEKHLEDFLVANWQVLSDTPGGDGRGRPRRWR